MCVPVEWCVEGGVQGLCWYWLANPSFSLFLTYGKMVIPLKMRQQHSTWYMYQLVFLQTYDNTVIVLYLCRTSVNQTRVKVPYATALMNGVSECWIMLEQTLFLFFLNLQLNSIALGLTSYANLIAIWIWNCFIFYQLNRNLARRMKYIHTIWCV